MENDDDVFSLETFPAITDNNRRQFFLDGLKENKTILILFSKN